MHEIARILHSGFLEIGGWLGVLMALVVTIWIDRWSRVPFGALIAMCLYGIAAASILAMRHHIFRLPNYAHAEVWIGFIPLYIGYCVLMAIFFFAKSLAFGPSSGR